MMRPPSALLVAAMLAASDPEMAAALPPAKERRVRGPRTGAKEKARRARHIERGQVTEANGLEGHPSTPSEKKGGES